MANTKIHVTFDQMRSKANKIRTTTTSTIKSSFNKANVSVSNMSKNWKGKRYNEFSKWYADNVVPNLDKVLVALGETIPDTIMKICINYQRSEGISPFKLGHLSAGKTNRGFPQTDVGATDYNSTAVEADRKSVVDALTKAEDEIAKLIKGFKDDSAWKSSEASGSFVAALNEQRNNISKLKNDIVSEINKAIKARNEDYSKTESANKVKK